VTDANILIALFFILILLLFSPFFCDEESCVSVPTGFQVFLLKGEIMANVLTYSVSAAAPVDADVVARLLTLVVNGEEQGTAELPASATDSLSIFSVPQDAEVVLTLVDVDDAGNKSEPAVLTFTAVDTIAPAQPGSFGVTLVSETQSDEQIV
jgi:hypothetical protein